MSTLHVETNGHVATITIQSPPANALSSHILNDLSVELDNIENNQSIKAIVLKGEDKFFSAGADIKEFTSFQDGSDSGSLAGKGQELFNRIENFHIPVIAAIHGAALGGGLELAMACHIRYVAEDAKLGLPELNLGIIPGFAGTQRLPRHVGAAKAYEMILTGVPISGEEAVEAGLANQSFSNDELFVSADKTAQLIAAKSGPSIHHIMKLIPYAHTTQLQEGIQKEAEAFGAVFGNEDAVEGVQAFIEKRKPEFKDK
ncbi:enoyl-CoA hydratase [Halobacillus sp. A1]|uniref:enoyl-CoA hydratase n=1 Tax=Halobacillus sp. A1 TaxID=2880262 RepID=UPI0020A62716|nr:enoyl-CoA hydratase [Halobacillus sp. A1]MCP3030514.1 enoyl-CoA hydratase [Halobacillus sp. A1]